MKQSCKQYLISHDMLFIQSLIIILKLSIFHYPLSFIFVFAINKFKITCSRKPKTLRAAQADSVPCDKAARKSWQAFKNSVFVAWFAIVSRHSRARARIVSRILQDRGRPRVWQRKGRTRDYIVWLGLFTLRVSSAWCLEDESAS
jgi:hypothetical protein